MFSAKAMSKSTLDDGKRERVPEMDHALVPLLTTVTGTATAVTYHDPQSCLKFLSGRECSKDTCQTSALGGAFLVFTIVITE
jgi:hypothetical protein